MSNINEDRLTLGYINNLQIKNRELKEENERLNNIINEIEKTLLDWHEYWINDDNYEYQYKDVLDILQELKGSDSNEERY